MITQKVKSSLYLNPELYRRAAAYKQATSLPINTICVLALEEFLQAPQRKEIVSKQLSKNPEY